MTTNPAPAPDSPKPYISEYYCKICKEIFVGEGGDTDEHYECGTICAIVAEYYNTPIPPA